ncbi:MAG: ABC transporter permease, partial [Pseudomonadota bacterium]|nr:ABC transporter permease [Pseudomonadota bacterium]
MSLINLLGLSLALLACILIFMFILHELQYDTFYDNADETHRLSVEVILPDKTTLPMSTIGGPAAPLLESSYPGVKLATRLQRHGAEFSTENQIFSEENFYTVDENFFEVFNFNILSGKETEDLLSKPDSIVLTRSLSQRYFGSIDSVGKTIMLNGNTPLEITGVIEDIPSNSHLDGNAFSPFQVLSHQIEDYQNYMSSWWGNGFYTYVVLEESSSIDNLVRNLRSQYADIPDIGLPPGTTFKLHSIPLSEIHMDSHNLDELKIGGNIQLLWIFFSIGACILFIATANFINLSILWFTRRRKETGLKRVIGAQKIELASQFMFESLMLCITCVIFSLLFSYFLAPVFGELLQIELIPELKSRYSIAIALIIFS